METDTTHPLSSYPQQLGRQEYTVVLLLFLNSKQSESPNDFCVINNNKNSGLFIFWFVKAWLTLPSFKLRLNFLLIARYSLLFAR